MTYGPRVEVVRWRGGNPRPGGERARLGRPDRVDLGDRRRRQAQREVGHGGQDAVELGRDPGRGRVPAVDVGRGPAPPSPRRRSRRAAAVQGPRPGGCASRRSPGGGSPGCPGSATLPTALTNARRPSARTTRSAVPGEKPPGCETALDDRAPEDRLDGRPHVRGHVGPRDPYASVDHAADLRCSGARARDDHGHQLDLAGTVGPLAGVAAAAVRSARAPRSRRSGSAASSAVSQSRARAIVAASRHSSGSSASARIQSSQWPGRSGAPGR